MKITVTPNFFNKQPFFVAKKRHVSAGHIIIANLFGTCIMIRFDH